MRAAAAIAAFVIVVAGCASAEDPAAEGPVEGFPSLRDVPTAIDANTDPEHWRAIEGDLRAAQQTLRQHPRAQPASPSDDPAVFLEEARQELEQARQSREP